MSNKRRVAVVGLLAVLVALAGCTDAGTNGTDAPTEDGTGTADVTVTPNPGATPTPGPNATPTPNPGVTPTPAEVETSTATPTDVGEPTPIASPTPMPTVTAGGLGLGFEIVDIFECGTGCRDVTYAVNDTDGNSATDVTADITITAGDETIWTDTKALGDVPADGSVSETARIEVGFSEAAAIDDNDGKVTITVDLSADGETETIVREREF